MWRVGNIGAAGLLHYRTESSRLNCIDQQSVHKPPLGQETISKNMTRDLIVKVTSDFPMISTVSLDSLHSNSPDKFIDLHSNLPLGSVHHLLPTIDWGIPFNLYCPTLDYNKELPMGDFKHVLHVILQENTNGQDYLAVRAMLFDLFQQDDNSDTGDDGGDSDDPSDPEDGESPPVNLGHNGINWKCVICESRPVNIISYPCMCISICQQCSIHNPPTCPLCGTNGVTFEQVWIQLKQNDNANDNADPYDPYDWMCRVCNTGQYISTILSPCNHVTLCTNCAQCSQFRHVCCSFCRRPGSVMNVNFRRYQ